MILNDIALICFGNLYDRYFLDHKEEACEEVKLINKNAINNGKIDIKDPYNTTSYWVKKGTNHDRLLFTQKGDILIKVNNPKVALIEKESGYIITNQFILIRCHNADDSSYIFSLLSNNYVIDYLANASNSKNGLISVEALRNMPVSLKYREELTELLQLINMQEQIQKMQNKNIIDTFMEKAKEE